MRYYLLAKTSPSTFKLPPDSRQAILRHIPGNGQSWTDDKRNEDVEAIESFLDANLDKADLGALKIPDRVLEKWGRLFDIVKPNSRRTCCFTRGSQSQRFYRIAMLSCFSGYTQMVEKTGSILQMARGLDVSIRLSVWCYFSNLTYLPVDGPGFRPLP